MITRRTFLKGVAGGMTHGCVKVGEDKYVSVVGIGFDAGVGIGFDTSRELNYVS